MQILCVDITKYDKSSARRKSIICTHGRRCTADALLLMVTAKQTEQIAKLQCNER